MLHESVEASRSDLYTRTDPHIDLTLTVLDQGRYGWSWCYFWVSQSGLLLVDLACTELFDKASLLEVFGCLLLTIKLHAVFLLHDRVVDLPFTHCERVLTFVTLRLCRLIDSFEDLLGSLCPKMPQLAEPLLDTATATLL